MSYKLKTFISWLFIAFIVFSGFSFFLDHLTIDPVKHATWATITAFSAEICKEIAITSLIAVFLALTVEKVSKGENKLLIDRIQQNVLSATFGFFVNNKLKNEVINEIFRRVIYFEDYSVTYLLEEIEGQNNHVKAKVITCFKVINNSNKKVTKNMDFWIEIPEIDSLKDYCKYVLVELKDENNNTLHSYEEGKLKESYIEKSKDCLNLKLKGIAVDILPGKFITVRCIMETARRKIEREIWICSGTSDGLNLRVIDNCRDKMSIHGESIHHSDLIFGADHGQGNISSFILDTPLFPNNGIMFWWNPDTQKERTLKS